MNAGDRRRSSRIARSIVVAVTVAAALATAGCGGGATTHYSLLSTLACLQKARVDAKVDRTDPLFSSVSAIDANFNRFDVYIGFGKDSGQAHDLASSVNSVGSAFGAKGASAVTRANVVYYANAPTLNPQAQRTIDGCLTSGQEEASSATTAKKTTTSSASPGARAASLILNHQLGTIRLGESYARVQYEWGSGRNDGCSLMDETPNMNHCDENIEGPILHYNLQRGYVRVGFSRNRVVYIETNSPRYKTSDGIGIGISIPYAKTTTLDGTKFTNTSDVWIGFSKLVPEPRTANAYPKPNQAYTRWVEARKGTSGTVITTDKGRVIDLAIFRGDVNLQ